MTPKFSILWFAKNLMDIGHPALQISTGKFLSKFSYVQYICIMAIWVWSFQTGGTKLERFLPKNQPTQRKLLNFENWVDGEVSNIGHHFRKYVK